jgi:exopolyphosphatase/guanosine-5'-triphosphate,3'-diphosphate pyrophosphatase
MPEKEPSANPFDRAVFDIGSNAVKFTAMSFRKGRSVELFDREQITRLASGLNGEGILDATSFDRTVSAVGELLAKADLRPEVVDVVGTWILREAKNSQAFADKLFLATGLHLRTLSEPEEACAGFVAVRDEPGNDGPLATLDHGGGSTDLAFGTGAIPEWTLSLPIGARRLARAIPLDDPPTFEQIERVRHETRILLEEIKPLPVDTRLAVIGGAAAAFSVLARRFWKGSGERATTLTPEALDVIVQKLGRMTHAERRRVMAPDHMERADVIVHSAVAMRELLGGLGRDTVHLSLRGVGHGVLIADAYGIPLDLEAPRVVLPHADFPPLSRKKRRGEVLFALVNNDGEIWLQRKNTYPEKTFRLPGGGIDRDESPTEAVRRELAEETGLREASPHIIGRISYTTPDGTPVDFHSDLFLMFSGNHVPVTEDKHEDVAAWFACPPDELQQHENRLRNLAEPLVAWGTFRAAALAYLREKLKGHVP